MISIQKKYEIKTMNYHVHGHNDFLYFSPNPIKHVDDKQILSLLFPLLRHLGWFFFFNCLGKMKINIHALEDIFMYLFIIV